MKTHDNATEVNEDGFIIGLHPFSDKYFYVSHINRPDRFLRCDSKWEEFASYFDSLESANAAILKATAPNNDGVYLRKEQL